jgi:hypothetical protein
MEQQPTGQLGRQEAPRHRRARHWGSATAPVELMAHCVARKGALFVYLALQLFEAPTIGTLATVCGMAPDGVRRSLKWLEAEGWIQRIERPGESSLFRVFFERIGAHRG